MKNEIIDPTTIHTLEERKAITDDALKVAKHTIRKTLEARIMALQKVVAKTYDDLGDLMFRYNTAVRGVVDLEYDVIIAGIEGSFKDIALLSSTKLRPEWEPAFELNETALYYGVQGWEWTMMPHADYLGLGYKSILTNAEKKNWDRDLTIRFTMCLQEGTSLLCRREMEAEVEAPPELITAREDLAHASAPYLAAREELAQVHEELSKLSDTMVELDMQATAARLQAAGGSGLLDGILESTQKILAGEAFDGLATAMALPTQSSSQNQQQPPALGAQNPAGTQSAGEAPEEDDTTPPREM